MSQAVLPLIAPGEGCSCLFQLLGASGIPGLVTASLQFLPPLPHNYLYICMSPNLLLLTRTPNLGFNATLLKHPLLLLGRKVMTSLDSILKSRDITLPARSI